MELARAANALLADKQPMAARDLLRDAAEAQDAPPALAASYGWALISSGEIDKARAYLSSFVQRSPGDPGVLLALSHAQERSGEHAEALSHAAMAYQISPENAEAAISCARLALAVDRADWALSFAGDAVNRAPDNQRAQYLLSAAADASGQTEMARLAAEAACRLSTGEAWLRLWLARMQERDGRPTEALASARAAAQLASSDADTRAKAYSLASTLAVRTENRAALGEFSTDISRSDVVASMPEWVLRQFHRVHVAAGRHDLAGQAQARIEAARASVLPSGSLAGALGAIETAQHELPPLRGRWQLAWSLADHRSWSVAAWQREAIRGVEASKLITEWWDAKPAQRGEIDDLIDISGVDCVKSAAASGSGYIVVGAHLGPALAGMRALHVCGLAVQVAHMADYLANKPEPGSAPVTAINLAADERAVARQIAELIKAGSGLVTAADHVQAKDALQMPFLGHKARVSTLAPRLAHRYGAATIWMSSSWENGRIVVRLEPLPAPQSGEAEEDWVNRWCAAYLAKVEAVMRGHPRNINVGLGIWENFPG